MRNAINRSRMWLLAPLLEEQSRRSDEIKVLLGQLLSSLPRPRIDSLRDAEFQIFSQYGEDGIIQFLIGEVPIDRAIFIEIGVQDYSESNTRFLLLKDDWTGYIFDRGTEHVTYVQQNELGWRRGITATSSHITRENVNQVLSEAGVQGDIGLFSIDIDGTDYWILDALSIVTPRILIAEYNSMFGPHAAVTVPYDPSFDRTGAHFSNLYFGASLAAINEVVSRKGYSLVGCNSAGSNAFFVRDDLVGDLPTPTVEEAYVMSRFREARDSAGALTYINPHTEGLDLLAELPVWDVSRQTEVPIGQIVRPKT